MRLLVVAGVRIRLLIVGGMWVVVGRLVLVLLLLLLLVRLVVR